MTKHDASRREFLVRAAVGAGAAAGAGPRARRDRPDSRANGRRPPQPPARSIPAAASTARSSTTPTPPRLPRSPNGSCPARRANRERATRTCSTTLISRSPAPTPICRISTGAGSLSSMPTAARHYNEPFVHLSAATTGRSDHGARSKARRPGFTWPTAQEFFNIVRTHTMEGMFADPLYGGNKDFAGWRLVVFPARRRFSRRRICRANKRSRARPSSACKQQAKGPMRRG